MSNHSNSCDCLRCIAARVYVYDEYTGQYLVRREDNKQEESKMKKPTQRKINSEITKMLRSYEDLIADPFGKVEKWKNYGDMTSCRMCRLCGYSGFGPYPDCAECPISIKRENMSCGDGNSLGELMGAIDNVLDWQDGSLAHYSVAKLKSRLRQAAKRRYKILLKLLAGNGYEYK